MKKYFRKYLEKTIIGITFAIEFTNYKFMKHLLMTEQKATARIEGLESGLHVVTVVADGVVSDSKQVIIK